MRVLTNGGTDQGWTVADGDTLLFPTELVCWPLEEIGGNYQFRNLWLLSNFREKILAKKTNFSFSQICQPSVERSIFPPKICFTSPHKNLFWLREFKASIDFAILFIFFTFFDDKTPFFSDRTMEEFLPAGDGKWNTIEAVKSPFTFVQAIAFWDETKEIDFVLWKQLNFDSILSAIQF